MDGEQASRFVSSLVKSIQALCNGYIEFSSSIEVIGHIHLNIDRSVKLDYVLTEEVSKSISEGATVFASHSYHSQPPSSVSSKSANDTSGRSRQKQSASVTHSEDSDMVSQKRSSSHFSENSEPSHTGSFVDTSDRLSGKPENRQKFSLAQESFDRRRRSAPVQSHLQRTSSPAAKRSRQSDCNSELNNTQNFEVIEIKEEPDDEPAVFFGDSSSHAAAGQDLQTPDFSNVVMESLDRVGKVEGTDLVGSGEGGQMQQQPFPVMMHANSGMPSSSVSSSVPGPSLADPQTQSLASTSGSEEDTSPPVSGDRSETENPTSVATTPQGPGQPCKQKHYLQRIPKKLGKDLPSPLKGAQATLLLRPCKVCQEEGFGKVSAFFCPMCPGQPAFCCTRDCFISYHKRKGYSLLSVPVADAPKKPSPKPYSFQLRSYKYL